MFEFFPFNFLDLMKFQIPQCTLKNERYFQLDFCYSYLKIDETTVLTTRKSLICSGLMIKNGSAKLLMHSIVWKMFKYNAPNLPKIDKKLWRGKVFFQHTEYYHNSSNQERIELYFEFLARKSRRKTYLNKYFRLHVCLSFGQWLSVFIRHTLMV